METDHHLVDSALHFHHSLQTLQLRLHVLRLRHPSLLLLADGPPARLLPPVYGLAHRSSAGDNLRRVLPHFLNQIYLQNSL